ncbi:MAG: NDP-sugar synthase [Pseudomonadota bacterium]
MGKIKQAMILAAGLGLRARPLTLVRPKPLFPVWGRPNIVRLIDLLIQAEVEEIVVNLHHLAPLLEDLLSREKRADIRLLREKEILGTGGGLGGARAFLTSPFFVINSDIFLEMDLGEAADDHLASGAMATLVMHDCPAFNNTGVAPDGSITGFRLARPEPPHKFLTFSGLQALDPGIFKFIPDGPGDIIAVHGDLIAQGLPVRAHEPPNFVWRDFGTSGSYLELHSLLARRDPSGPIFIHPEATVHPGAVIEGWACLGKGAVLEPGAAVKNSILWPGARIAAGVRVTDSVLADRALAVRDLEGAVLTGPPPEPPIY